MSNVSNYTFEGQKSGENIQAVLRRNPWSYLKSVLPLVIFLLIPWLVAVFVSFTRIFSITFAIFYIVGFIWTLILYYLWISNVVIITDERVLVVNLKNPLNRQVTEVPLRNIQDTAHESRGLFSIIFGYGNIVLQTAGSGDVKITLRNLDDPYAVQQLISKNMK